ncbi:MAG: formylmethanofuran--tetrahydromethanopterin N-formyltransferase [Planctomycetes bacterium]|nr:formylmethanofuran--tetrahydromethanopterin N-formyltransferase [Planctomycetota bacterium]
MTLHANSEVNSEANNEPWTRPDWQSLVDDTYAEAFRSIYARVLVTARDRKWLLAACEKATGHASSTILCDCEAGIEQILDGTSAGQQTPDGRIGALLQFHVPRFRKDRAEHLERVLLARLSQNVLTCPTTRCFNALDSDPYFKLGRKIAFFGDGHQFRSELNGQKGWTIPTLGGEFFLSRRFGYADGIMGGNLWFLGTTEDAAIEAADRAAQAANAAPNVITTFPGGVAASASKAGSKYKFLIASTYAEYCPTLREKLGDASRVPEGVRSIMEIIVNGSSLEDVARATYAAIEAALPVHGLVRISAGNYGGRLGKSFIYLHPHKHPSA